MNDNTDDKLANDITSRFSYTLQDEYGDRQDVIDLHHLPAIIALVREHDAKFNAYVAGENNDMENSY